MTPSSKTVNQVHRLANRKAKSNAAKRCTRQKFDILWQ